VLNITFVLRGFQPGGMSMEPVSFNFLHFSDLHWGSEDTKKNWNIIKRSLIEDIERIKKDRNINFWDAVFFSGDIINQGNTKDFSEIAKGSNNGLDYFLSELEGVNNQEKIKFYCVPGNHDCHYSDDKAKGDFSEYYNWINNFNCKYQESSTIPGNFYADFEKQGINIAITGLNFNYNLFKDAKPGDFQLKENDLLELNKDYFKWLKKHNISILLTHYPQTWFPSDDNCDNLFRYIKNPKYITLHLCGHLHANKSGKTIENEQPFSDICQAGSLFSSQQYKKNLKTNKKNKSIEKNDNSNLFQLRSYCYSIGSIIFCKDGALFYSFPRKAYFITPDWVFQQDPTFIYDDLRCYNPKPKELKYILKLSNTISNNISKSMDDIKKEEKDRYLCDATEQPQRICTKLINYQASITSSFANFNEALNEIIKFHEHYKNGISMIGINEKDDKQCPVSQVYRDFFKSINENTKELWFMGTSLKQIFAENLESNDYRTNMGTLKERLIKLLESNNLQLKIIINNPFVIKNLSKNDQKTIATNNLNENVIQESEMFHNKTLETLNNEITELLKKPSDSNDGIINESNKLYEALKNQILQIGLMHFRYKIMQEDIPKYSTETLKNLYSLHKLIKREYHNKITVFMTDLPFYVTLNYKLDTTNKSNMLITHYLNFGQTDKSVSLALESTSQCIGNKIDCSENDKIINTYKNEFNNYWKIKTEADGKKPDEREEHFYKVLFNIPSAEKPNNDTINITISRR
jgi:hypothetical protein